MGAPMASLRIKQMNLVEMNAPVVKWPCLDSARPLNDSLNWYLLAEKLGTLKRVLNNQNKCEKSVMESHLV